MHLKSHRGYLQHHTSDFGCSQCGESFVNLALLSKHKNSQHMKTKHKDEFPGSKHCDTCEITFSSRQSFKYHYIVKHTKELPQMCEGCGKGFTGTGLGKTLETHKKSCLDWLESN